MDNLKTTTENHHPLNYMLEEFLLMKNSKNLYPDI